MKMAEEFDEITTMNKPKIYHFRWNESLWIVMRLFDGHGAIRKKSAFVVHRKELGIN